MTVTTLMVGANQVVLAAGDGWNVRPGGCELKYCRDGFLITAGADTFTITNLGASTITYEIYWLFASA
jgi:hypothetical protein